MRTAAGMEALLEPEMAMSGGLATADSPVTGPAFYTVFKQSISL